MRRMQAILSADVLLSQCVCVCVGCFQVHHAVLPAIFSRLSVANALEMCFPFSFSMPLPYWHVAVTFLAFIAHILLFLGALVFQAILYSFFLLQQSP